MGLTLKSILVLGVAIIIGSLSYLILRDGSLPEIPDQYWGIGSPTKEDTSIRPFQINISEKLLTDLKTRLSLEVATLDEKIADTLDGIGFEYGMNKNFLRKVGTYWLSKYDWKEREKRLNKYQSFKTKVSGIDIHFQQVKPTTNKGKTKTRVLLLLHGWPGSFTEYQNMIPLLVDAQKNSDFVFELVIASLPGFGFSEAAKKTGLGAGEMSLIFLKLMKRLGHEKFYVHGSDWGSIIASNMMTLYRDNVLGIHMTMCQSSHPRVALKLGLAYALPGFFLDEQERQMAKYSSLINFLLDTGKELGYMYLQGTKPDTVGVALSSSPLGYLAYVLEKPSWWTNNTWLHKEDGGIMDKFKLDELIDNIMVHWFGRSITSGLRIYRETFSSFLSVQNTIDRVPLDAYASCLNLPGEPLTFPRYALLEKYPKLRYTTATTGGHFGNLEVPGVIAQDIIQSITFMGKEPEKTPPTP